MGRRRDAHGPGGRVASPALGRSLGLSAGSQFAWQCVAAIALTGHHQPLCRRRQSRSRGFSPPGRAAPQRPPWSGDPAARRRGGARGFPSPASGPGMGRRSRCSAPAHHHCHFARGPAAVVLHASFDSLGRFVHVARSKRACVDVCRWQGPSGVLCIGQPACAPCLPSVARITLVARVTQDHPGRSDHPGGRSDHPGRSSLAMPTWWSLGSPWSPGSPWPPWSLWSPRSQLSPALQ